MIAVPTVRIHHLESNHGVQQTRERVEFLMPPLTSEPQLTSTVELATRNAGVEADFASITSDPVITSTVNESFEPVTTADSVTSIVNDILSAADPPEGNRNKAATPPVTCATNSCPTAGLASHDTALHWANSPKDAYQLAFQQKKLVFLIHVSGNFAIPGFT